MLIEEESHRYIETDPEKFPLLLLHGLFGNLSNFEDLINSFSDSYNLVLPILPIFEMPLRKVTVRGLTEYVSSFVEFKGLSKFHILGNSLGGHIAQIYTLENKEKVSSMTLTGSSGLFEHAFGSGFVKRNNYEFIKQRAQSTFYDPAIATKEMVDEVFASVNDRSKALRLLSTAKSAIRENLENKLQGIECPTLLVWGKQDIITPPFVAEKFNELISGSELHFIDKCGHAPMMERPQEFNEILQQFLAKV